MKLCKDCKHLAKVCNITKLLQLNLPLTPRDALIRNFDGKFYCIRKCKIKQNPVNGDVYYSGELLDCEEQRAEISELPNRCGADGKFYESHLLITCKADIKSFYQGADTNESR